MPVDLSMTGLAGIKAADDSADSAQARLQSIADTTKTNLENQVADRDIRISQKIASTLQRLQSGDAGPDLGTFFQGINEDSSRAKVLDIVGNLAMGMGGVKQGTDALKAASDIRRNEALNERDKFENAKDKVQTVLETANAVSQTIGVAQNESEWRYGLAQLRKNQVLPPEQLDQLDQMDYDPNVVAYLNDQAVTAYQRAQLDLTSNRDAATKRQADARIDNSRNLTIIAQARLKLAQEAEARAAKVGKVATAPNDNEVRAASAAIISQVFNGKTPTTLEQKKILEAGAVSIASRTQQLLRDNKALDYDTALNRAVIESQTAGDWDVTIDKNWFSPDTVEAKFKTPGSRSSPMPPPMDVDGKVDKSKFVKGKYYITAHGPGKWTGSGFKLVTE